MIACRMEQCRNRSNSLVMLVILATLVRSVWAWATVQSTIHGVPTLRASALLSRRGHCTAASLTLHGAINGRGGEERERQREEDEDVATCRDRRQAFVAGFAGWLATAGGATAAGEEAVASSLYRRRTDQVSYDFQPPTGAVVTGKPLKTHLDEVNFKVPDSSLQFGITVDPVRIQSLRDFGTPEQVAGKVVLAELNRDGVFDVTLMEDPLVVESSGSTLFYQLNYLSVGKRGTKRFITRFAITNQKLYALTAQCNEEEYKAIQDNMQAAVQSFLVNNP